MQTYQVRKRVVKATQQGARFTFPNECELRFTLEPPEPFGGSTGPSRTVAVGTMAKVEWNSTTGRMVAYPDRALDLIDVTLADPFAAVEFKGNRLIVRRRLFSLKGLAIHLERIAYHLPLLLNVEMADAPVLGVVSGRVGDVEFVWQYASRSASIEAVEPGRQVQRIHSTWIRLEKLREHNNRRMAAALHWFHVACRLERVGHSPWEFMGEILLNYSKILEVLFPGPEGKTIDAVREGLAVIGVPADEIERWFVPALALRSNIDVAHVSLTEFELSQLQVLHDYAEAAEGHFRKLLLKVLDALENGQYVPPPYTSSGARGAASTIIERMRMQAAN